MSTTHSANRPLENARNLASQHSRQPTVGSSAYQFRLISKEIRQIAPLLIALVGCGLILHLFHVSLRGHHVLVFRHSHRAAESSAHSRP